jgi:hypothetical protein
LGVTETHGYEFLTGFKPEVSENSLIQVSLSIFSLLSFIWGEGDRRFR